MALKYKRIYILEKQIKSISFAVKTNRLHNTISFLPACLWIIHNRLFTLRKHVQTDTSQNDYFLCPAFFNSKHAIVKKIGFVF